MTVVSVALAANSTELMKGNDCKPCTVLVWFSSALPLLLIMESMSSSVVYPEWDYHTMLQIEINTTTGDDEVMVTWVVALAWAEKIGTTWAINTTWLRFGDPHNPPVQFRTTMQLYEGGHNLYLLGASMAVFLFCLYGFRVLWPKCFQGESSQHDIDFCGKSGGLEDVDCMTGNGHNAFIVFAVMWLANLVFLVSVASHKYLFSS